MTIFKDSRKVAFGIGAAAASAILSMTAGCTQTLPSQFLLQQQQQSFSSQMDVNTKVDLLWVVDNSASMDIEQERLRDAFSAFANTYMQPTWDIRVAAITTDTYLANAAYSNYLNTVIPGTVGYNSSYITSRLSTFVNPPNNPTLVNKTTGDFTNGIMYKDLMPAWGMGFGRLLPGLHDGPIAALCINDLLPYFYYTGATDCPIRDDQSAYNGAADCLNPTGSETSETQCVNTLENDTVRSGQPIINTMPPTGTPGDETWINNLVDNFVVDLTTGSAGNGSERGIQSVLELLADNENTSTAFFRPGSLRGIIFVSDEDDQTMSLPDPAGSALTNWTNYACDQAGLVALNGAGAGNPGGYCCTGGQCSFGTYGTSCTPKTVDGYTYTISICPNEASLMPLATAKSQLDTFFQTLDGNPTENPNYMVFSIVALTGSAIQALQTARYADDSGAGAYKVTAVDRADRYIGLGNLVGNGSQAMDISSTDYSPILTTIGNTIIQNKGTFTLTYAPTGGEEMIVSILHANGTSTVIPSSDYTVSGNVLTITNLNVILSFQSTDQIVINYQPSTSVAQ